MSQTPHALKFRLSGVFIIVLVVALIIIVRLFILQVVQHKIFQEKATHQYSVDQGGSADRGTIYMQSKDGTLFAAAITTTGYTVGITPKLIHDKESVYKTLSQYLTLDYSTFMAHAAKTDDPYEQIATHVSIDVGTKIANLKIPGVVMGTDRWRTYPGNTLASRVIGFLGYKGTTTTRVGAYGLEKEYNDVLTRDDSDTYVNFFADVFGRIKNNKPLAPQSDIVTTLDPEAQRKLEDTLGTIQDTYHSNLSGGIVMDPKTGAIYAMGALPDFDLNNYNQVSDQSLFSNPLVNNVYEIGSVVKALTLSAGLDKNLITPETTYDDKGILTIDGQKVGDFDKQDRGVISMQEVINHSLNTGAIFVMHKLGHDLLRQYFTSFGLREKTGIDMPNEVQNITSNIESTRDVEYATASFGQGIAVTPISAARAFASIANDGILVTPHVLDSYRTDDGIVTKKTYPDGVRVLSPAAAETMTRMLVVATDTSFLGGSEKMAHYSIALKTGTAQMARSDGRGYESDKYLHSIFAYFPAYDPKYIIFLYTVDPKGMNYAANTLGHPLFDLIHFLISYGDITPDR